MAYVVSPDELARDITTNVSGLCIVDARSFLEYNDNHIKGAINVSGSKLIKRKLQSNELNVLSLLTVNSSTMTKFVVYNQAPFGLVDKNEFVQVLVRSMAKHLKRVCLLEGGFSDFALKYPKLCESRKKSGCSLLSISTPCSSSANCPPTKVLPFLYLGCEEDAHSEDLLRTCRVKYVLNASLTAADSPHCTSGHYLRIPIKDSSNENIIEWFQTAFEFIDRVKESDDNLLLHCVGGVSRSAAIAIAYVMRHLSLSLENAYRYVKEKRPTISPNLNFMGQLLEFEGILKQDTELIFSPFPEINLEGLSLAQEDHFSGFPSPDSDTMSSPDVPTSGLSDNFMSQSESELSDSCEVTCTSRFMTDAEKPKLKLDITSRKMTLNLCSERT